MKNGEWSDGTERLRDRELLTLKGCEDYSKMFIIRHQDPEGVT